MTSSLIQGNWTKPSHFYMKMVYTCTCQFVMGSNKPLIPGQRLFLSLSAGNAHTHVWLQPDIHMIDQTSRRLNKAKQINSTRLRKSFFPKKNWLPQVGFEPTTLCSLDRVLCQLSHRGSSVDVGRISYTNTK